MSRKRLINTANLHAGGAIQVASSVLHEMLKFNLAGRGISAALSSEVADAFGDVDLLKSAGMEEIGRYDVRGFDPWNRAARAYTDQFDTVFTVFGPLYRWRVPFRSIVGFAQPWIIYPHNEVYAMLSPLRRLGARIKYRIHSAYFKRADMFVVELDHVKEGLVRELGIDPSRIRVIRNCVSSIYKDETAWGPVHIPPQDSGLRFGFIGRNYLHKNTAMFPEILSVLRKKHGIDGKFYVTFNDEEWRATSPAFRESCINIGPLAPSECPRFYEAMDAVVFPSLLECFSATPLEAMAMGKPLFASDRRFNRDVCGDHAQYFDPLSPEDAARSIAQVFGQGGPDQEALEQARQHAFSFSSPAERAQQYLALFDQTNETLPK